MNKTIALACSFFLVGCVSFASAEVTKTVYNPFTGRLDYITVLNTTTITNQFSGCSGTQYLGADGACHQAGGGGGTSSLSVGTGTASNYVTQFSSPTSIVNFNGNQFIGQLTGGSTAFIDLNPSTTYFIQTTSSLQSGATFYVSSGTVLQQLTVGPATAGIPNGTQTEWIFTPQSQTTSQGTLTLADDAGAGNLPRACINVSSASGNPESLCINPSNASNALTWTQGGVTGLAFSNGVFKFGNNGNSFNSVNGFGTIDSPGTVAIEVVGQGKIANSFAVSAAASGSYLLKVSSQGLVSVTTAAAQGLNVAYNATVGSMTVSNLGTNLNVCTDGSSNLTTSGCASGGGGGSSTLEVLAGGVRVTSPTASLSVIANAPLTLSGSLVGGNTAQLTLGLSQTISQQETFTSSITFSSTTLIYQLAVSTIQVTGSYTTVSSVTFYNANCASACTITLATPSTGTIISVLQGGAGNVTLSPSQGTISGGATALMNQQYSELDVAWDGNSWWVK